jgi:amino acid transporter
MGAPSATPRRSLSTLDAVAIIVGMVIGAGIFSFPSMVAGQVNSGWMYITVWLAGGVISLIGALCYAELATTYPDAGGDYYFLRRAFGDGPSFLFAWARMSVIQTGSIALQAFIIGDYAARLISDPNVSQFSMISSACAAVVVAFLTALNVAGVREGKWTQKLLTGFEVLGLLLIVAAGFLLLARSGAAPAAATAAPLANNLGLALVFVLFTFGGWNEAAYLSAEVAGERRSIVRALVFGIGAVTAIYLLVNVAFLFGLGLDGMKNSQGTVAADLLQRVAGTGGAKVISLIIVIAALSTVNATIFTGARTNYALGRDFSIFRPLGVWNVSRNTPSTALIVQGLIALLLVGIGAWNQRGIRSMVDYTFPVFWFFFLLAGVSLFVLRWKEPRVQRPFKVPLYPLLPLIFCATCAYMLYSSVTYNGKWSLVGLAVLAAGIPLMLLSESRRELPDEHGKFPGETGGFTPIVPPAAAEPMES